MSRTTVYRYAADADGNRSREEDGWFDPDQVKAVFAEAVRESTAAPRRRARKSQTVRAVRETLFRTAMDQWVLETALADRTMADRVSFTDRYEFLSDSRAANWLERNGHGPAILQWLPDMPPERGRGRPEIGGRVQVRLGNLLGDVDRFAEENGYSRAEAVRALVSIGLRPRDEDRPRS